MSDIVVFGIGSAQDYAPLVGEIRDSGALVPCLGLVGTYPIRRTDLIQLHDTARANGPDRWALRVLRKRVR